MGDWQSISLYHRYMDFTNVENMNELAGQLRKPEGAYGREVGKVMAQRNSEATAFTLRCLDVQESDHVLEIGFGPGEGIAQAVQLTPKGFVAGVDYSSEMVEMAKERNHRALMQEQAELILGSAQELPFADESFQKIFAVNVFHFWTDPTQELAECVRVLKPRGCVAFFMAFPASWLPGLRDSGVFIAREPEDVEALLTKAGLINMQSRTFTLKEYRGFAVTGEKT